MPTRLPLPKHGRLFNCLGQEYTPTVGSIGGEWMVLGLARSGREVPAGYYDNVVSYVNQKIDQQGRLHSSKSTDNSRLILALTAMGKDVTDVGGHNLLQGLTDMKYVKKQGINGPIWALIALDCHGYEVPTAPTGADPVTRQKLIEAILDGRLADGGWSISGRVSDADMTGMAIQALAPYYKTQKEVQVRWIRPSSSCLSCRSQTAASTPWIPMGAPTPTANPAPRWWWL